MTEDQRVVETETISKLTCLRCGGSWFPRGTKLPKFCAICNNSRWNQPRKEKKSKAAKDSTGHRTASLGPVAQADRASVF
jgi:hypothetical protein